MTHQMEKSEILKNHLGVINATPLITKEKVTEALWTMRDPIAGGVGSFCCIYSGAPFDTVKVRLQAQNQGAGGRALYKGSFDCLRKTFRAEGLRALYKGSTPALYGSFAENSILFATNGVLTRFFSDISGSSLSIFELATIGAVSGIVASTALTPFELIKCRLQVQRTPGPATMSGFGGIGLPGIGVAGVGVGVAVVPPQNLVDLYKGPLDCAMKVMKADGMAGLFNGWGSVVLRDLPYNFVMFGSYEASRYMCLWARHWWTGAAGVFDTDQATRDRHTLGLAATLFCGGVSGAFAWAPIFPIDMVKTRIQTQPKYAKMNVLHALKEIARVEGINALYKGFSPALIRAFPTNAGLFFGVEYTRKAIAAVSGHQLHEGRRGGRLDLSEV